MFIFKVSTKAKKDLKRLKKTSIKDFKTTEMFILKLLETGFIGVDIKYKPHELIGNYKGYYECHIKPDLLLIWSENENEINVLKVIRVGSHSELF